MRLQRLYIERDQFSNLRSFSMAKKTKAVDYSIIVAFKSLMTLVVHHLVDNKHEVALKLCGYRLRQSVISTSKHAKSFSKPSPLLPEVA